MSEPEESAPYLSSLSERTYRALLHAIAEAARANSRESTESVPSNSAFRTFPYMLDSSTQRPALDTGTMMHVPLYTLVDAETDAHGHMEYTTLVVSVNLADTAGATTLTLWRIDEKAGSVSQITLGQVPAAVQTLFESNATRIGSDTVITAFERRADSDYMIVCSKSPHARGLAVGACSLTIVQLATPTGRRVLERTATSGATLDVSLSRIAGQLRVNGTTVAYSRALHAVLHIDRATAQLVLTHATHVDELERLIRSQPTGAMSAAIDLELDTHADRPDAICVVDAMPTQRSPSYMIPFSCARQCALVVAYASTRGGDSSRAWSIKSPGQMRLLPAEVARVLGAEYAQAHNQAAPAVAIESAKCAAYRLPGGNDARVLLVTRAHRNTFAYVDVGGGRGHAVLPSDPIVSIAASATLSRLVITTLDTPTERGLVAYNPQNEMHQIAATRWTGYAYAIDSGGSVGLPVATPLAASKPSAQTQKTTATAAQVTAKSKSGAVARSSTAAAAAAQAGASSAQPPAPSSAGDDRAAYGLESIFTFRPFIAPLDMRTADWLNGPLFAPENARALALVRATKNGANFNDGESPGYAVHAIVPAGNSANCVMYVIGRHPEVRAARGRREALAAAKTGISEAVILVTVRLPLANTRLAPPAETDKAAWRAALCVRATDIWSAGAMQHTTHMITPIVDATPLSVPLPVGFNANAVALGLPGPSVRDMASLFQEQPQTNFDHIPRSTLSPSVANAMYAWAHNTFAIAAIGPACSLIVAHFPPPSAQRTPSANAPMAVLLRVPAPRTLGQVDDIDYAIREAPDNADDVLKQVLCDLYFEKKFRTTCAAFAEALGSPDVEDYMRRRPIEFDATDRSTYAWCSAMVSSLMDSARADNQTDETARWLGARVMATRRVGAFVNELTLPFVIGTHNGNCFIAGTLALAGKSAWSMLQPDTPHDMAATWATAMARPPVAPAQTLDSSSFDVLTQSASSTRSHA